MHTLSGVCRGGTALLIVGELLHLLSLLVHITLAIRTAQDVV
jgi:hypothetical protein